MMLQWQRRSLPRSAYQTDAGQLVQAASGTGKWYSGAGESAINLSFLKVGLEYAGAVSGMQSSTGTHRQAIHAAALRIGRHPSRPSLSAAGTYSEHFG
jgi:hypothetical protein